MSKRHEFVEGPQPRPGTDMSAWHRVVDVDGSTIAYCPDKATAQQVAKAVLGDTKRWQENVTADILGYAAAPSLLEAAKGVEALIRALHGEYSSPYGRLRVAIAEADGK